MPGSNTACDAFAAVGLTCDPASHAVGTHHTLPTPFVLSGQSGERIELRARLAHWDHEPGHPGHPVENEVVLDLGVELLELKSPTEVRNAQAQLLRFAERVGQLADQLQVLQNDQLRRAVTDPTTELGQLLAEQNIPVLIADGPNAALLDSPLLFQLDQVDRDTLLLPPGAEPNDILRYVRDAIPQRAANRAAGRPAWDEPTDPSLTAPPPPEQTSLEDELSTYLAEHGLRLVRETGRTHVDIGRLANDMCIVVPADMAPEAVLECARKHVAGREPVVKHGRTWTYIDREDGAQRTVTCPSFCSNDHSRDILTPTYAQDIWHQDHAEGVRVSLTDTHEPPTPWRVLEPQLAVVPRSTGLEGCDVPHVNIELVDGVWTNPLGPDELAEFIETLSDGLEKLRLMHSKLVSARADWPTTT
ncbi:hypothetical protein ABZZ46_07590 [Streptomyces rochei]|uniref:DUF6907 domain-containing protein n=1 Tax=Streptomyces rochei TaxID=1928 RepID=UPI0033A3A576